MFSDSDEKLKPFLWFTLYKLLTLAGEDRRTRISTPKLADILGGSQQSASRHLQLLEERGMITRQISTSGSIVQITDAGIRALNEVYFDLKNILEGVRAEIINIEGAVFSGFYQGSYYIGQHGYRNQIKEKLGFNPYPGTLNLRLKENDIEIRRKLDLLPSIVLKGFKSKERAFGAARCYPVLVNAEAEGAIIIADRTSYDLSVLEIISPINLRGHFDLEDGDIVKILISSSRRSSS